jgi:hypothetical protein
MAFIIGESWAIWYCGKNVVCSFRLVNKALLGCELQLRLPVVTAETIDFGEGSIGIETIWK